MDGGMEIVSVVCSLLLDSGRVDQKRHSRSRGSRLRTAIQWQGQSAVSLSAADKASARQTACYLQST